MLRRLALPALVAAATLGLPGLRATSAAPAPAPGSFQGLTVRNASCCGLTAVSAWGYRNGEKRLFGTLAWVPAARGAAVPFAGSPQVIDRLDVELCTDPASGSGLSARFPDSTLRFGERRITRAQVTVDRTGSSGQLTVFFFGGGCAAAPLEPTKEVCTKERPPAMTVDPTGLMGPVQRAGLIPLRGHENEAFEHLEVQNDHPNQPVETAKAYRFRSTAMTSPQWPLRFRGVVSLGAPVPAMDAASSPKYGLQADRVAVELRIQGTFYVALSPAKGAGFKVQKATAYVAYANSSTQVDVVFQYHGGDQEPVTATVQSTSFRWTGLGLTSTGQAVSVSVCTAQCLADGSNLVVKAMTNAALTSVPDAAALTLYTTLYVCVDVNGTKTQKRLEAENGDVIKMISVSVASDDTVVVSATAWGGNNVSPADAPACVAGP